MADTWTGRGRLLLELEFLLRGSVEVGGSLIIGPGGKWSISQDWDASGGTAPTFAAGFYGVGAAAAGDLLLAASDPLQGMGSATFKPPGVTVSGALKLKLFALRNNDTTNSITLTRGAANGVPNIFTAAGDGMDIAAGGVFLWTHKEGTAVITTTSNDKLTIAVSGGTPAFEILCLFGT